MKTEIELPKAEFTRFDNTSNWVSGKVNEYTFEAKLFDTSSSFGINNGRISKLSIYRDNSKIKGEVFSGEYFKNFFDSCIVNYDRGWDIRPSKENRPVFKSVMELLENSPKRFI